MEAIRFSIPENTDLNKISLVSHIEIVKENDLHTKQNEVFMSMLQKSFHSHQIFKTLLETATPLDFEMQALGPTIVKLRQRLQDSDDLQSRENVQRKMNKLALTLKQKLVIIIRHLLKMVDELGFGMGVSNDEFYCYNGRYWEQKDRESLLGFLGEFAEGVGLDNLDAQQFTVKEFLFRQFNIDAPIPQFNSPSSEAMILVQNGTLTFINGKPVLSGFKKEHFFKYILPFEYDSEATAPMFEKFLNRVLPDIGSQKILFEFFGSAFSPINHEKMLLLYGHGRNGKSVLYNIMLALLGEMNVSSFSLQSLCDSSSQTIALIENTLMNFASEIGSGKLDVDVMKQLTSKEPVKVKVVYKKPYLIRNYGRLAFNCNTLPREAENNEAFHRRIMIIPFSQTITNEEVDIDLAKKIIAAELPGILNMIIDGLSRLISQNGVFSFSEIVHAELEKYKKDSSSILSFLHDERFIVGSRSKMPIEVFFEKYRDYCLKSQCQPFKKSNFNNQLRVMGFKIERSNNGYYYIDYDNEFPSGFDDSAVIINIKS